MAEPLRMNPEIRERWVKALLSGRYQQGYGALCAIREDGSRGYCCLGVLEDLAVQDGITTEEGARGSHVRYGPSGELGVLENEVSAWAGIENLSRNPMVMVRMPDGQVLRALADLNDGGKDFAFIAAAIKGEEPLVSELDMPADD